MQVYVEVSSYANLKCVRVLRCIIPGARHLLQFTRVLFRNAGVDMSASRVVFPVHTSDDWTLWAFHIGSQVLRRTLPGFQYDTFPGALEGSP